MAAQQYLHLMAKLSKRHRQMVETAVWPLDQVALLGMTFADEEKSH